MKNNISLKINTKTRRLVAVLATVFLCVVITGVIWVERMTPFFINELHASVIEVVPEDVEEPGDIVEVKMEDIAVASSNIASADGVANSGSTYTSKENVALVPGFEVYDENTLWGTETEIEIFKISYANGENVVTVHSDDSDKLLAPGTENEYTFWLKNTGNITAHYTMETEAYFSNSEYAIPVEVRMKDYSGNYLLGDDVSWDEVLRLNEISDTASLGPNSYASYTLEWQWPFESDDEYDTLLGNLALEEDLTLTIVIRTIATAEYVKTGDDANMTMWFLVVLITLLAVVVLVWNRKRVNNA